ncbi:MAG: protein kinase domain-containing protein [Clostridia bacterium]
MIRCMGCMREYEDGLPVCPHCGYRQGTPAREAYQLPPETILNGRYLVGRVLGFGGFGTTYIAWDLVLEKKVAIKEYMPSDFATRAPGETQLSVYDGELGEQFEAGLKSFINESRRLAKFNHEDGIVHIFDSFLENGTAYIVMEYLEGKTLKELLKEHGGKIPYEEAVGYILPVLKSLDAVHQTGIIHRDIAPDNIFLTNDGKVKLIDFGASRYATTLHSKSLSVILKQGYAPEEQYRSHGEQGPWSDVYAVCATLYRAITGIVPEDALERCANDKLVPPSKMGINLPVGIENAILNGLNTKAENRIQSAKELAQALSGEIEVQRIREEKKKEDVGKWSKKQIIIASCSGVAVIAVVILAILGVFSLNKSLDTTLYATVPDYIGMTLDEAQADWVSYCESEGITNISLSVLDGVTADTITGYEVNSIYAVAPEVGSWFKKAETEQKYLYVTVVLKSVQQMIEENQGKDSWVMQNLENYSQADAQRILESMGDILINFIEVPSEKSAGTVINTIPGAGMRIERGATVTVYISNGSRMNVVESVTEEEIRENNNQPAEEPQLPDNIKTPPGGSNNGSSQDALASSEPVNVTIPNLCGDTVQNALIELENLGILCKTSYCYSETYESNHIAKQSLPAGESVAPGTELEIWISSGDPDAAWSEWQTYSPEFPTGDPDEKYETKSATQYRYRTRSTYQENVYGSWSSTTWSTSQRATSDTVQYMGSRQVETQKHYKTQYLYTRWCGFYNGQKRFGATESDIAACTNRWNEDTGWLDYALPVIGISGGSSGATMYEGYWYNQTTRQVYTHSDYRTEYGYQTRTKDTVTKYTNWGKWSTWSFEKATASDIQDVETRTVYSYRRVLPVY